MEQLPQVIDAMTVIGMIMRPDYRIDPRHIGGKQLFPHIGTGVDQQARRILLN